MSEMLDVYTTRRREIVWSLRTSHWTDRIDIFLNIGNQVLSVFDSFLHASLLRAREIQTLLTPFIHDSFLISTEMISTKNYE
jgi:hypothetical protein